MGKIRVIQYGTWKYTHASHTMMAMRHLPNYYEVVGICEPHADRRAAAMRDPTYDGLRWIEPEAIKNEKNIDAIIVESHELEQGEDALKFIRQGYAVHMDKPGGADAEIFSQVLETTYKTNTVFQPGYVYRYNPAVQRTLELVRSGKLGDIICTEMQMSCRYSYGMAQWLADLPGGMMFYLGSHLVDVLCLIQGEPQEVIPYICSTGTDGTSSPDYGLALYRYPHGISFLKTTSSEMNGFARRQMVVSGTKGTVEIKPIEKSVDVPNIVCPNHISMQISYAHPCPAFDYNSETVQFPVYGRYDSMLIDFSCMVAYGKKSDYSLEHEALVHKILLKSCGK